MEKYLSFIVMGICAVYFILMQYLTRKYSNELKDALTNNPDNFDNIIDKPLVKFLFQGAGREFIRLNYFMSYGTKEEVQQQFELLDSMKIHKKQKNQLFQTMLQYYIMNDDKENSLKLVDRYNNFADENNLGDDSKKAFAMEIEMYFEKTMSCIEYIDERMQFASEAEKVVLSYKKAVILKENNYIEEAKECVRYIMEATTDPKQREVMEEALNNNLETL